MRWFLSRKEQESVVFCQRGGVSAQEDREKEDVFEYLTRNSLRKIVGNSMVSGGL